MKKSFKIPSALSLLFVFALFSCSKDRPSGNSFPGPLPSPNSPTGGGPIGVSTGSSPSNCSFWIKDPYDMGDDYLYFATGILTLTIGTEIQTLHYAYGPTGPVSCGHKYSLNFNLPTGLHTWTANFPLSGRSVSGTVLITAGGCTLKEIFW